MLGGEAQAKKSLKGLFDKLTGMVRTIVPSRFFFSEK